MLANLSMSWRDLVDIALVTLLLYYLLLALRGTLPSLGGWCISIASDKPEQYEYLRRQRPASCPLC